MSQVNVRWAFNISKWNPTLEEIMKCSACIQKEEKERLGRFYFKKDFLSSLVGQLMLRKFASDITSTPYNKVLFSRDGKGKPILIKPDAGPVKFNISHQGDYVVLAGSNMNKALGIDLMKIEYKRDDKLKEYFRLMNRQFSDYEWETIKQGNSIEQCRMFYRHWCLKESYVKALGVGITVDLRNISFKVNRTDLQLGRIVSDTVLYVNGVKQSWKFDETLLDQDHCVAIATEGLTDEILFEDLDICKLLEPALPILDEDIEYSNNYFKKMDK